MNERESFVSRWGAETQTTLKVMKAFPSNRGTLKPAEKIRNAQELMTAFVTEQALAHGVVAGTLQMDGTGDATATIEEIIGLFETGSADIQAKVKAMPDSDWESSMDFFVGPGKVAKVRRGDIFWFLLNDMIHHRGQLSVYVRMAGGTTPSIYGPTLEEPWF